MDLSTIDSACQSIIPLAEGVCNIFIEMGRRPDTAHALSEVAAGFIDISVILGVGYLIASGLRGNTYHNPYERGRGHLR